MERNSTSRWQRMQSPSASTHHELYHTPIEINSKQNSSIITPVTVPTEWCAPIVVTPKKDTDAIKLCVDLSHLNKYVKRERYQSATPAQAVADISAENAKIFTKLDAMKGYHQCPLDEESQTLLLSNNFHHTLRQIQIPPNTIIMGYHPCPNITTAEYIIQ